METSTTRSIASRLQIRLPIAAAGVVLVLLGWSHAARAGSLHHAALVVQHSSGRLLTRCVAFIEDQITGYQLVQRSGIEYQAQAFGSMGNAMCQLDDEPQDVPSSCFGSGAYWQYFHRTANGWALSSAGATTAVLHDGDMDGWRYAAGSGQAPANLTFASVCAPTTQPVAPATTVPTRTPAVVRAATAPPSHAASTTPTSQSPPGAATASLVAMAPTVSPTAQAALAATDASRPPPSVPMGTWLLLGGAAGLLIGLIAINLLRRSP